MEKLKVAIAYGADAVYLAGKDFGLRAYAGNFSIEEMKEALAYARERNVKVYVTVNIFPHNQDLVELPNYLVQLAEIEVDAIIVADPGVVALAKQYAPKVPIHISTQANTTNWASVKFWAEQGVERVVLARELSQSDIREIKDKVAVELEVFVHGAMCISYSGRCLLSNYMADRDANKGACAQACRWQYSLVEEKRPNDFLPIEEDQRGTYVFNSQDLALIYHIPEVVKSGADSLKIEGRMKSINYVASVVKVYREAIDRYFADPETFTFDESWREELTKVSHRPYSTGFFLGKPQGEEHSLNKGGYLRHYDFIAMVKDYDPETGIALVEQRNRFFLGDQIEVMGPKVKGFKQTISKMWDAKDGEAIESAPHAQQLVKILMDEPVEPFYILRRGKVD